MIDSKRTTENIRELKETTHMRIRITNFSRLWLIGGFLSAVDCSAA